MRIFHLPLLRNAHVLSPGSPVSLPPSKLPFPHSLLSRGDLHAFNAVNGPFKVALIIYERVHLAVSRCTRHVLTSFLPSHVAHTCFTFERTTRGAGCLTIRIQNSPRRNVTFVRPAVVQFFLFLVCPAFFFPFLSFFFPHEKRVRSRAQSDISMRDFAKTTKLCKRATDVKAAR